MRAKEVPVEYDGSPVGILKALFRFKSFSKRFRGNDGSLEIADRAVDICIQEDPVPVLTESDMRRRFRYAALVLVLTDSSAVQIGIASDPHG